MMQKAFLKMCKAIVYACAFLVNISTRCASVKANRLLFISYFSNEPEGNYKAICDALSEKGGFDIVLLLKKYEGSAKSKLSYFFDILKQAYYFNTAKVVVLDGNSVVMNAIVKKKKTIVLQIWHACAALKKIGGHTKARLYSIRACDVAVASCEKVRHIYAEALNIPQERVFALGTPRTDALFSAKKVSANRQSIYDKYALPADRKLLLYAPTFRGGGIDDVAMPEVDIVRLANALQEDAVLAVRLHPLIRGFVCPDNVINLTHEDLIEVLCAADALITDYSTVLFEYAVLERPMVFHAPDLERYTQDRGFYMDYEAFVPGQITKTHDELADALKSLTPCMEKIRLVKNDYFDTHDGRSTQRVAGFIAQLCSVPDTDSIPEASAYPRAENGA